MKTSQFPERSGITGFTRDDGTFQCTGSVMGRHSDKPASLTGPLKLRVRSIHLDSGGYDDGGAYWGTPSNLYEARGEDSEIQVSIFGRASSKAAFIATLRAELSYNPKVQIVSLF